MQGKIIKGIAGFYYVYVENLGVYECKAKGIFRNQNIKPLVGDNVVINIIDEDNKIGNIEEVCKRTNELIRPAAANIDQAMLLFAITNPEPNYNLLNRFLVMMCYQGVPVILIFNKMDLDDGTREAKLRAMFSKSGCELLFISTYDRTGLDRVYELLKNKTTILAGPSGVGKSSLTNLLMPDIVMQTGEISRIGRGRHTTRHSEIFHVYEQSYICDTPGFTSLNLPNMEKEQLRFFIPEFSEFEGSCRFNGCVHVSEPDCAVKNAVEEGRINKERYLSYCSLYEELKKQKKY